MKFDLSSFSPRQLDVLIAQAQQRKKLLAKRRPLVVVRSELIAMAANWGYTIEDVLGITPSDSPSPKKQPASRKVRKAVVKYRDPENKRNTWSGRGSQPRWMAEKTRRGQSAMDFLVPGLAKPTANVANMGKRTVFKKA